jgi:ketosteroid isomerase-like protein
MDHAQLVRRFYEAWSANDVDGVLAVVHPDIEFRPILGVLYEQEGFHGHAEMAEHVRLMHERWDDFTGEVELTREVEGGLIAFVCLTGTRGGRSFDARIAVDVRFRDDLIASFVGRDVYEAAEELDISP